MLSANVRHRHSRSSRFTSFPPVMDSGRPAASLTPTDTFLNGADRPPGGGILQSMLHPRVMVAEDDAELRELLVKGLRRHELEVTGVGTGAQLLAGTEEWRPDALVVDIGLPDADGRDVCQALRARGANMPVLFLTARDTRADRLSGFASGGDDYVTKPFDLAEGVARLRGARAAAAGAPAARGGRGAGRRRRPPSRPGRVRGRRRGRARRAHADRV